VDQPARHGEGDDDATIVGSCNIRGQVLNAELKVPWKRVVQQCEWMRIDKKGWA